jgi:hypothetical protein
MERVKGNDIEAIRMYEEAIKSAGENEFIPDTDA